MAAALPPSSMPPSVPPGLSATGRSVLQARREPGRGWAALFAFAVHLGFFALIVFGVSWQVKVPTPLSAELWESLPVRKVAQSVPPPTPEPEPAKAEPPPPPPSLPTKPATPSKADIALKAKQLQDEKRQRELDEKAAAETKKREELKRADDKRRLDEDKQRKLDAAKAKAEADRLRAEQEAREAAVRAARDKVLADYTGKIAALIRSRANIPDSVTGQPEIQVRVRLLTNGTVFEASISKPSGNRAFDEAVERAINGIRQWPVPENPEILGRQRELLLNIKHER
jgi:colicin import membrane protein